MRQSNFIGTVAQNVVYKINSFNWESVHLWENPIPIFTPPRTYLFSMGSANLSLPSTSSYGIEYTAGIDNFRWNNWSRSGVDVDRILFHPYKDHFMLFQVKPENHHLKLTDSSFQDFHTSWQAVIKKSLG